MCKILSIGPKCTVIAEIPQVGGLYSIVLAETHRMNIAKGKLTICEAHHILGHISQTAVKHMVENGLVEGLEIDSSSLPEFCDVCTKAKATCQPFPNETKNRTAMYAELVHTDLRGPVQMTSLGGCTYYISFTHNFSRQTKVEFLKAKSEALTAFKQYKANLAQQSPSTRICKLRSDRGGEYLSAEFDKYLKNQGIERQLTMHDSPQQNGVAEHLNGTLVSVARAMLLGRNLPKFLWAEASNYAVWLKNRLPSRAIPGHTPHDLIHNVKLNLTCVHEFGTNVFVHLQDMGKLEARAEEAVFVGVDEHSKGYHIYWLDKHRVSVERNVSFVPVTVDLLAKGESNTIVSANTPDNAQKVQSTLPSSLQVPSAPPVPVQTPPPQAQ